MPNEDYIKRSEAVARLTGKACCVNSPGKVRAFATAINVIETMPAADAVPVVRCKECRYWEKVEYYPDGYKMCCRLLRAEMHGECFCSLGTQKEREDAE